MIDRFEYLATEGAEAEPVACWITYEADREIQSVFTFEGFAASQYENDPSCVDYEEAVLVPRSLWERIEKAERERDEALARVKELEAAIREDDWEHAIWRSMEARAEKAEAEVERLRKGVAYAYREGYAEGSYLGECESGDPFEDDYSGDVDALLEEMEEWDKAILRSFEEFKKQMKEARSDD